MATVYNVFSVLTKGNNDLIDITLKVQNIAQNFNISNGLLNLHCLNTNSSILLVDDKEGVYNDLISAIDTIVPVNGEYNSEINEFKHSTYCCVRTAILGKSLNLPIIDNKINISDNQKIILIDFSPGVSNQEISVCMVY